MALAPRGIDIHETMKKELYKSQLGCEKHYEKNRPCPSDIYGVSDQYIILDSFEKLSESRPSYGEYRWNFSLQGSTGENSIGVRDILDTITEIHVGDFFMPIPSDIPYVTSSGSLVLTPNPAPPGYPSNYQLHNCGVVTLELLEIGLQSISDSCGRRHHFEFRTSPAAGFVDRLAVTPMHRFEIYIFTKPIKDIHGLTIVFRGPDNRINMPEDNYDNAEVIVGIGQLLTFNIPGNNLSPGDHILVSNFVSANVEINRWVNDVAGKLVGTGGFVPGLSFRLNPDVDVTSLGLLIGDVISCARVRIFKNRLRIPLRLRRVVDGVTQYHVAGSFP